MLQLSNVQKIYDQGARRVHALRGISLRFRKSEFVSILGPSGCGKTTLLNLIGGLDQNWEGELTIGGKSTAGFSQRDWDAYRNHSIGFVFQNYHLIPHQTVLQNVELALTLSGVPGKERRQRAIAALERVGLGDQLHKRPNQMSGGQMQRAAIARALVNEPEILLADEPTGALDSRTSSQVMDILKEISRERLVIVVTHNPELAKKYSTRILYMADGTITRDTNPLEPGIEIVEKTEIRGGKRRYPQMSMLTACGLSLNNLISKMGRTVMTVLAGSIGIIGIGLVFAISQGTADYITMVQRNTLTAYPLTLEASTVDTGTLIRSFINTETEETEHLQDGVFSRNVLKNMVGALSRIHSTENDLGSFLKYLQGELTADPDGPLRQAVGGIACTYDLNFQVYTKTGDGRILLCDTEELLKEIVARNPGLNVTGMMQMQETVTSALGNIPFAEGTDLWTQLLPGMDGELVSTALYDQYDLVAGSWPESYDQVVLVVDENNALPDLTLYALGLKNREEIDGLLSATFAGNGSDSGENRWEYAQLLSTQFRVVLAGDCYVREEDSGKYVDLRLTEAGLRYLYDNGIQLRISGIVRPKKDAAAKMITGAIGYTGALTEYVLQKSRETVAVVSQLENPGQDIFSGLPFREAAEEFSPEDKAHFFREQVAAMSVEEKAKTCIAIEGIPSREQTEQLLRERLEGISRNQMEQAMIETMESQIHMGRTQLQSYIGAMSQDELLELYTDLAEQQIRTQLASRALRELAPLEDETLAAMLEQTLPNLTDEECVQYFDEVLEFSDRTFKENLQELGYVDPDKPAVIHLYASSFEQKKDIEDAITRYNDRVGELYRIRYTDYVGILVNSVTTILRAITCVLIGLVAISLIVSSIMIGVIILISVQERTREIGILRALGASRRNITGMFLAETAVIGLAAGISGIVMTSLLCIPVNILIQKWIGIDSLRAILPWQVAMALVALSVLLTLIAGLFPARIAATKDPVQALRTE